MELGNISGSASDRGLRGRAGSDTVRYRVSFVVLGRAPAGRPLTHQIISRVDIKRIMYIRQSFTLMRHDSYDPLQSAIELSLLPWNLFQVLRA